MAHVFDQVNLLPTTSRMNRNVKTLRSIVSQCSCQLVLSVHPGLIVQTPLLLESILLFHGTGVAGFLTLASYMLAGLTNTYVEEFLDHCVGTTAGTNAVLRLITIGIVVPEQWVYLPAVHRGSHASKHLDAPVILRREELKLGIIPVVISGNKGLLHPDAETITKDNNTSPDSHGVLLGDEKREPIRARELWNYARRHRLLTLNLGKMGERLSTAVAGE
jgi:hypothetical protein